MLGRHSMPGAPQFADPLVRIKVLIPFYMAGKLYEEGVTMSMLSSEAQAGARSCNPPRVEII
jgi:hypothetical protein